MNIAADLIKEMSNVEVSNSFCIINQFIELLFIDFKLRTAVYYKYTAYQPFVIDYTVNYCEFMKNTVSNKIMDIVIAFLSRFSNNTHACPFTPPEKFVLRNAVIDADIIPKFMPVGEYRIDMEYKSTKNVRYALIEIFVETRSRSLVDLKMG